jgi:hypothetical protein
MMGIAVMQSEIRNQKFEIRIKLENRMGEAHVSRISGANLNHSNLIRPRRSRDFQHSDFEFRIFPVFFPG